MKFSKLSKLFLLTIITAGLSFSADAQSLSSVSSYRKAHADKLARQSKINERIHLEENQKYAKALWEDIEPEPDIYTEGWESGLVNPYKEANIPNSKRINVRNYVMPIKHNLITSPYGYRARFKRVHKGVDLRAAIGDTVYAAFSGRIRLTKYERSGYGFYVIVRHENSLETVYGHLSRFLVKPDQYVKAGQPIALAGNTGRSTGSHLHFETRLCGVAINPALMFDFREQDVVGDSYMFNRDTYKAESAEANRLRGKVGNGGYNREDVIGTKPMPQDTNDEVLYHKVSNGETLQSIAKKRGVTVDTICRLNHIGKNMRLRPGQILRYS